MSTAEVTEIALRPREVAPAEMSVEQMIAQTQKIQACMKAVMKENEHYGVIPGTGTKEKPGKPTLLKPGAEKLCLMFRLDPQYEIMHSVETPERISFTIRCTLYHIPTGARIASGLGSCNSREAKYVRPAPKTCPKCGGAFLINGNPEYERDAAFKGGMLCYQKKGGCGAKFKPDDETITKQATGIADPADLHNTILKMGCKRALIAAVLNGTAASDFFTQDLEDLTEKAAEYTPPAPKEDATGKASGGARDAGVGSGASTATATTTTPASPAARTSAGATAGVGAKAPRANTVKHDGTFANHKQVALLHILKSKIGGMTDKCDCYDADGKRINPARKMCLYHTQLAAFKDCDGRPIRTSKDLSEDQISNLISRYEAKIKQQEGRAAEGLDTGAVGVTPASTPSSDDDPFVEVRGAIDTKEDPEACLTELCEVFRIPSLTDLPQHEVPAALALVMAWETAAYGAVLERVRP